MLKKSKYCFRMSNFRDVSGPQGPNRVNDLEYSSAPPSAAKAAPGGAIKPSVGGAGRHQKETVRGTRKKVIK